MKKEIVCKTGRSSCWVKKGRMSAWRDKCLINEVPESGWRDNIRMSNRSFYELCDMLRPSLQEKKHSFKKSDIY